METEQEIQPEQTSYADEQLNREQIKTRQKLITKIQKAFFIFDPENKGVVHHEEIKYVIRTLELSPTEKQLEEFMKSIRDDETIEVPYEKFEPAILPIMEKNLWPKASEELLLQAFRTIENTLNQMQADAEAEAELEQEELNKPIELPKEGEEGEEAKKAEEEEKKAALEKKRKMKPLPPLTGRISADKLQELLSMHGEPLKQTELEDFMKNLPIDDGEVDYAKLSSILANE